MAHFENFNANPGVLKAYRDRRKKVLGFYGAETGVRKNEQRVRFNQKESTILIYGPIDEWTTSEVVWQLRDVDPDEPIVARLNTAGGDVFEGMALANMFQAREGKVTTVVDGKAFSAGALIFLAGDVRLMAKNLSRLMFHRAWTCFVGFGCGNADAIAELDFSDEIANEADWLNGIDEDIAGLIADRSNLSLDEAKARIAGESEWKLSAEQAVEEGIATGYEESGYEDGDKPEERDEAEAEAEAPVEVAAESSGTISVEPDRAQLYAGMFGG